MTLSDAVECDETYVIAGHKGQPEVVKSKGRPGRRRRRKGKAGRGTMEFVHNVRKRGKALLPGLIEVLVT